MRVRCREWGLLNRAEHMNAQCWPEHARDPCKPKPGKMPCLAEELSATVSCWERESQLSLKM